MDTQVNSYLKKSKVKRNTARAHHVLKIKGPEPSYFFTSPYWCFMVYVEIPEKGYRDAIILVPQ